jgi:hypothetical protein
MATKENTEIRISFIVSPKAFKFGTPFDSFLIDFK